MNAKTIATFTELAFQFGPFFFALLFTLVISRWTYKIYHAQGKASNREKDTYRWVFISTTAFGMVLVVISVVWWWNYRPTTYVFRGEIKNLTEYERLMSSNLYFKSKWMGKIEEGIPQFHDEEFAVIQEAPFSQGQEFDMLFSKRDGSPQRVTVNYDAVNKMPQFKIVWDDSAQENKLQPISKSITSVDDGLSRLFVQPAFAREGSQQLSAQIVSSASAEPQIKTPRLKEEEVARVLQDERSGVGNKIAALDRVLAMDKTTLRKFITTETSKEDIILTITDLTRHSDKELASKAKLLVDLGGINGIISVRLKSADPATVREAQQLVRRLDKTQATAVLKSLDRNQSASMKNFVSEVSAGRGLTPLKPTGSDQGDRYYVRARWDKTNSGTVNCLTRLFNRELVGGTSLADETEFMKGRSERWVYWYSKEWALRIATKIVGCGGKASFESPYKE